MQYMSLSRFFSIFWMTLLAIPAFGQEKPQIMILGTTHFNNPNHDISNMVIDDVLTPERQQQIRLLVGAIARFKPTRIAIELPPSEQSALDQRYADYRAGRYSLTSNERDQLGLRLAAMLQLPRLDAVDYKEGPPGPDEAYDFSAYAAAHGQQKQFDGFLAAGKQYAADETTYLHTHTMLEWFRHANTPQYRLLNNKFYFDMLRFGDNKINPGANWVGGWHARNLIILENVWRLSKPNDRILVIFGAGHTFLLNQFSSDSGEFNVIDTERYLAP
ncbi:hypothetical protein AciX9_4382 (plasmid) [Granulicella tundricola MP5ACTX9]|uniref:Uncharacterized protein n=2 Tax=Granulicella TaxID=940557 RepID=E8X799_GRATM|nr:hypothetical protein AciX9_4382 [Granulicella tundricola MP5ACTX9]